MGRVGSVLTEGDLKSAAHKESGAIFRPTIEQNRTLPLSAAVGIHFYYILGPDGGSKRIKRKLPEGLFLTPEPPQDHFWSPVFRS